MTIKGFDVPYPAIVKTESGNVSFVARLTKMTDDKGQRFIHCELFLGNSSLGDKTDFPANIPLPEIMKRVRAHMDGYFFNKLINANVVSSEEENTW